MSPLAFLRKKPKFKVPKGAAKIGKAAAGGLRGGEVEEEKTLPRLGIAGHAGSGKTVYLAMLHDVCKEGGEVVFQALDDLTAAEVLQNLENLRGATRRFLSSPASAERPTPSFPAPTAALKSLSFVAAVRNVERLQISVLDYPGSSVSIYEEGVLKKQVNEWLEESDGLLLLIDPATLISEADASSQVSSFRSLLLRASGASGKRHLPVALVFTKADQIQGFRDDTQAILIPRSLDRAREMPIHHMIDELLTQPEFQGNPEWRDSVRTVLNRVRELLPVLREHDTGFQIYFVSATGGIVKEEGVRPPDVLKPVGVREPLRWAIARIGAKLRVETRRKWAKKIAITCAILAAAVTIWNGLIWWWDSRTRPREGVRIHQIARSYQRFDNSVFMWFRFLTPEIGRASRERTFYTSAIQFHDEFEREVNPGGKDQRMAEILHEIRKMQGKSPQARSDLERLETFLIARWDDERERVVRQRKEQGRAWEDEWRKMIDETRKSRLEGELVGIAMDPFDSVEKELGSLQDYRFLTDEPLMKIKAACEAFLADSSNIRHPSRSRVEKLKAIVVQALAILPSSDQSRFASLRQDAADFPEMYEALGKPPTGGSSGDAGGVDTDFQTWAADSRNLDYRFNLSRLPRLLRERIGSLSAENRVKARDYLEEIDKWIDPGAKLQLIITYQARTGYHFHLGGPDGQPLATEYDLNHPREFRWRLGQPFVLYLSSNTACTDQLRTIDEWRREGTFSLFEVAAEAKENYIEFRTPEGPFRVQLQIDRLEQAIPVLQ